jgi:molybdopterin-guanine dinucleotide biosynthesis protein A
MELVSRLESQLKDAHQDSREAQVQLLHLLKQEDEIRHHLEQWQQDGKHLIEQVVAYDSCNNVEAAARGQPGRVP